MCFILSKSIDWLELTRINFLIFSLFTWRHFFLNWFNCTSYCMALIKESLVILSLWMLLLRCLLPPPSTQPFDIDILPYLQPRYLSWTSLLIFNTSSSSFEWLIYPFSLSKSKRDHDIHAPQCSLYWMITPIAMLLLKPAMRKSSFFISFLLSLLIDHS